MRKKAIFIAATDQNVGKTTLCLGIFSGLKKRFSSVGFIKPVGQRHVRIDEEIVADKDVQLFKEHFQLTSNYSSMSPVLCPTGFTRDFLDKKIDQEALLQKVCSSFQTIANEHPYVLVEGTGHVGVGSIFNLNNAFVAKALDLDIVIIVTGGLGAAIDELALNIEMCQAHGVRVHGILLNRVLEDKRQMLLEYIPKALARWNIPLLGAIPFLPYLSIPMMKDFEGLLETTLLAGESHRFRHFAEIKLIAGSLDSYLEEIAPNTLIITPACREEILLATIEQHEKKNDFQGGMILTGEKAPRQEVVEKIKKADIPTLFTPRGSFDVMKMITTFSAKIQKDDTPKIEKAIQLVEKHIDFDMLLS